MNARPIIAHQVLASDAMPEWIRYMSDFTVNYPVDADCYAFHSLRNDEQFQLWRRQDVLPDANAELRFSKCVEMIRKMKVGDGLVALFRPDADRDRVIGFSIHRDESSPEFTLAEMALARIVLEELHEMELRGHLVLRQLADTELTPRLAQMLDRVLSGKSAKEIAADLALSIYTVREHLQRLYQRYGVSTREELTAKFLR